MLDLLQRSITRTANDKIRSPLYGAFILSWMAWNWRIFYVTFFLDMHDLGMRKLPYIERLLGNTIYSIWAPLLSTFLIICVLPVFRIGAIWVEQGYKRYRNDIMQKFDNEQWMPPHIVTSLRKEIRTIRSEYEETLVKRNEELSSLQIDSKEKLEKGQNRINSLENEIQELQDSISNFENEVVINKEKISELEEERNELSGREELLKLAYDEQLKVNSALMKKKSNTVDFMINLFSNTTATPKNKEFINLRTMKSFNSAMETFKKNPDSISLIDENHFSVEVIGFLDLMKLILPIGNDNVRKYELTAKGRKYLEMYNQAHWGNDNIDEHSSK